jgi:hypothetical protein
MLRSFGLPASPSSLLLSSPLLADRLRRSLSVPCVALRPCPPCLTPIPTLPCAETHARLTCTAQPRSRQPSDLAARPRPAKAASQSRRATRAGCLSSRHPIFRLRSDGPRGATQSTTAPGGRGASNKRCRCSSRECRSATRGDARSATRTFGRGCPHCRHCCTCDCDRASAHSIHNIGSNRSA